MWPRICNRSHVHYNIMMLESGTQINEWSWTLSLGRMKMTHALNHHWYENSLLPQAALNYVVSRVLIVKHSVHSPFLYLLQEWRNLWYCFNQKFLFVICITFCISYFRMKVTSVWITFMSHLYCSVGHQQVWTTFNLRSLWGVTISTLHKIIYLVH